MDGMDAVIQEALVEAKKLERLLYIIKIQQEDIKARWEEESKEDVK